MERTTIVPAAVGSFVAGHDHQHAPKTAKALGITLAPRLLLRADEVME